MPVDISVSQYGPSVLDCKNACDVTWSTNLVFVSNYGVGRNSPSVWFCWILQPTWSCTYHRLLKNA